MCFILLLHSISWSIAKEYYVNKHVEQILLKVSNYNWFDWNKWFKKKVKKTFENLLLLVIILILMWTIKKR